MVRFTSRALVVLLSSWLCITEVLGQAGQKDPLSELKEAGIRVDVTRPTDDSTAPRPTIIMFHGGGWRQGSPDLLQPHAEWFAQHGFLVVNVGYRTAIEGRTIRDTLQDAFIAVETVSAKAAELGADAEHLYLLGESSGGHLAASVAMIPPATAGLADGAQPAPLIDGIILWNPIVDLDALSWLGKDIAPQKERKVLSPIAYLNSTTPPTLIIHGREDNVVPPSQIEAFAKRAKETEAPVRIAWLDNTGHAFAFGTQREAVLEQTLQWIQSRAQE